MENTLLAREPENGTTADLRDFEIEFFKKIELSWTHDVVVIDALRRTL